MSPGALGAVREEKVDLRSKVGGIGGRQLYWEYVERIRKSMKWNVPSIAELRNNWHGCALLICGGGPSLKYDLPVIREYQRQGGYVLTVNKTHDYFLGLDEPIIPWGHMVLDPMPWVADYIKKPHPKCRYFVASVCDPAVMRRLRLGGGACWLWHPGADFYGTVQPTGLLQKEFPNKDWGMIVGPTTVGLRSVVFGYDLGFRMYHLFGMDSSMAQVNGEYKLHAYPKDRPPDSSETMVTLNTALGSYQFYTNDHMARQCTDFIDMIDQIGNHIKAGRWENINMRVWGDGMLPTFAASIGLHGRPEMNEQFSGKRAA